MKFHRVEKYGSIEFTARKISLIESKPERQRKALADRLPLLADQLPHAAPVDVQYELSRRQALADSSELRMRSRLAGLWRSGRRDYFAAADDTRAAIRSAWDAWSGPQTASYFRYVVDLHTGVMAAREERFRQQQREHQAQRCIARAMQPRLF